MTQTRTYHLNEEQRKLVVLALSNTILSNREADFMLPMSEVSELFKTPIPAVHGASVRRRVSGGAGAS